MNDLVWAEAGRFEGVGIDDAEVVVGLEILPRRLVEDARRCALSTELITPLNGDSGRWW